MECYLCKPEGLPIGKNVERHSTGRAHREKLLLCSTTSNSLLSLNDVLRQMEDNKTIDNTSASRRKRRREAEQENGSLTASC